MSDCVDGEDVAVDMQLTGDGDNACVSCDVTDDTGDADLGDAVLELSGVLVITRLIRAVMADTALLSQSL